MTIRPLTATLAAALLALTTGAIAPTATASTPALIGGANGVVGIAQTVEVRAPRLANQTVGLDFLLAGQLRTSASVALNGAGSGSTVWTPTDAGAWTINGSAGLAGATASNLTVAAVPTITELYAVNQATVNVGSTLTAVVAPTGGTSVPAGSVTFTNPVGSVLATVPLTPSAGGTATANYVWTSTSATPRINITATFNPAVGAGGSANALSSSATDGIQATGSAPLVSMKLPGTFTVGRPINVGAVINNATGTDGSPIQGSVAFTTNVNGRISSVSGSVPLTGGQVTTTWTPQVAGNQVLSASFSATNSFISGIGSQIINVLPAPSADPISFGVVGSAAWPSGATVSAPANANIQLFTTTGSGAPTSISESGPCMVSGTTFISATSAGTCTLTVTSPGTAAFTANQVTVTVQVQAPPRKKKRR